MENCMIEEPCRNCYRVYCNCPPEEEDEYPWAAYTADDLSLFATEPPETEDETEDISMPIACIVVDFVYPPIPIRSFDWEIFQNSL